MQPVSVQDLTKTYGAIRALDRVSVEIAGGELFFLLGPSGCGKTTLLRSIAGFVQPDDGRISIGGVDATDLPPQRRNTGMVFQSYALWPHLSVLENVAFGLKVQKLSRGEVKRRAMEALDVVRMADQAGKKPNQLSGGQQQRVALARALAVRPACLLLDEPLSNLDAKLRGEMRAEIRRICKESGLTAIYVTHDQKEALAIADRIAVMRAGRVMQVGSPLELYNAPASAFVADFLGQTNLAPGRVARMEPGKIFVETGLGLIGIPDAKPGTARPVALPSPGARVVLAMRPEAISSRPIGEGSIAFRARVRSRVFLGETTQYELTVEPATGSGGPEPLTLNALELGHGLALDTGDQPGEWWLDQDQTMLLPAEPGEKD